MFFLIKDRPKSWKYTISTHNTLPREAIPLLLHTRAPHLAPQPGLKTGQPGLKILLQAVHTRAGSSPRLPESQSKPLSHWIKLCRVTHKQLGYSMFRADQAAQYILPDPVLLTYGLGKIYQLPPQNAGMHGGFRICCRGYPDTADHCLEYPFMIRPRSTQYPPSILDLQYPYHGRSLP